MLGLSGVPAASDIMQNMLLSDYQPVSELVVPEHSKNTPKYPVVDFHTHFGLREGTYDLALAMRRLYSVGVKGIVSLDGFWGDTLDETLEFTQGHHEQIATFGSVDVTMIDQPHFETYVTRTIRESHAKGIRGLKFFKSLSLVYQDQANRYIPVDDPRLQPIWSTAADLSIPVLIHIADPIAFFKPADKNNERYEELQRNPQWSFAKPGLFTYDQLMEQQENLLANNPKTTFVVAHVGSASENLSFVANQLCRFPNMYVDIAARLAELGRQPYTAREFLIAHQDRVLFGTDISPGGTEILPYYYRFLETFDQYFDYAPQPGQGRWKIYGVGLPDEVLRKVYYENAIALVPDLRVSILSTS